MNPLTSVNAVGTISTGMRRGANSRWFYIVSNWHYLLPWMVRRSADNPLSKFITHFFSPTTHLCSHPRDMETGTLPSTCADSRLCIFVRLLFFPPVDLTGQTMNGLYRKVSPNTFPKQWPTPPSGVASAFSVAVVLQMRPINILRQKCPMCLLLPQTPGSIHPELLSQNHWSEGSRVSTYYKFSRTATATISLFTAFWMKMSAMNNYQPLILCQALVQALHTCTDSPHCHGNSQKVEL